MMKRLYNIDFSGALRRIFGGQKSAVAEEIQAKAGSTAVDNKTAAEAAVALTIWTIERNRYAASRALCTDVEVLPSAAVSLCEDINGYVLDTPSGESVVVEARTGGLVGHSLEVVRDGVREMTKAQLNTQLDSARKEFNRMNKQPLSNEEFWKAIKMGGSELEIAQDFQE